MSRRAIFARDDIGASTAATAPTRSTTCFPRSRGGPHTWENVAAACRPCNLTKRDRTPDEAGCAWPGRAAPARRRPGSSCRSAASRRRGASTCRSRPDRCAAYELVESREADGRGVPRPRGSASRRARRSGGTRSRAGAGARLDAATDWSTSERVREPASTSCDGAAAGERCCSSRARSTWIDVIVPAARRLGRRRPRADGVARRQLAAVSPTRHGSPTDVAVTIGTAGRHDVVASGVLRRARARRGAARRPEADRDQPAPDPDCGPAAVLLVPALRAGPGRVCSPRTPAPRPAGATARSRPVPRRARVADLSASVSRRGTVDDRIVRSNGRRGRLGSKWGEMVDGGEKWGQNGERWGVLPRSPARQARRGGLRQEGDAARVCRGPRATARRAGTGGIAAHLSRTPR